MVSLTDWVNWLPMSSRDPSLLELQTHSAAPSFHMGAGDLHSVVSALVRQALSLWPQVKIILNSEVIKKLQGKEVQLSIQNNNFCWKKASGATTSKAILL